MRLSSLQDVLLWLITMLGEFFLFDSSNLLIYFRAIHYKYQPHDWAISWTVKRTASSDRGGHFFFAKYGVRVHNAANTLIAWKPRDWHRTSVANYSPEDKTTDFAQQGMAFVTSFQIPEAWTRIKNSLGTQDIEKFRKNVELILNDSTVDDNIYVDNN